jgi:hypothetical protein
VKNLADTHENNAEILGLSLFEYTKHRNSFTLKVFKNLLDVLSKAVKRSEAKYALLAYIEKEGVYVEIAHFKKEEEVLYATRKLKKIVRASFHGFKVSNAPLKEIDLVA